MTMMIVAQPMTWIVAIARYDIFGRISCITPKHFRDHVEFDIGRTVYLAK